MHRSRSEAPHQSSRLDDGHSLAHAPEQALARGDEQAIDLGEVNGIRAGRVAVSELAGDAMVAQERVDVGHQSQSADDQRAKPEGERAGADREEGLEAAVEVGAQRGRAIDVGPEFRLDEGEVELRSTPSNS